MAAPAGTDPVKWEAMVTDLIALSGRNRNAVDGWLNALWSTRKYPDVTRLKGDFQQWAYDRLDAAGLPQAGTHFTALRLLLT